MMEQAKKMLKLWRQTQTLPISAVSFSAFTILLLATICSAGTLQNRPAVPVQTGTINQNQNLGGKAPARRIMHPAFANAGKNPGLEIWRIENFEPVTYPQRDYGKFFTGDSYIVLNTRKTKNNVFSWDIHFWLGSETSQDEAGAAAILTVQLDDILNGDPIQHREVQDHESQLFLSYFKNGVRYEKGGVGSGFRKVEINAAGEKRLFQVKGKRNVRVRQVNLSISSMNKGDCFILDAGNDIYVYYGTQSKRVEKLKAISAANQIRDQDHNGRAKVHIIDEPSTDLDKEKFFTVLGSGSPDEVPDESTAEDDAAFEVADERSVTLYKVTDQSGALKVDTISTKPLRQEMLDTRDCFILDTGSGIYVWVGKGATPQEKSQSMAKAQEFLTSKKYPAWTQVQRIVEGAESAPFKQYFATWRDVGMSHTRLIRSALGYDSDTPDEDLDLSVIDTLKKSGGRAMAFMPDQGEAEFIKAWQLVYRPDLDKVENRELPVEFSILLGFASYVFQYNYHNKKGEQGVVIYAWEGKKAPHSVNKETYDFAVNLGKDLDAIVVRTAQGHEPRHFLKMFKGKLISSYTGAPVKPQLFRIRGTDQSDVRADEVETDSSSLASDDVFALVKPTEGKVYIWVGLGASDFEKDMAKTSFGDYWKSLEQETIEEGAEPDDFWEDLNGEGVYDNTIGQPGAPILEPRLFHCRLSPSGRIRVEEVQDYEQADLDVDDVMLIDGGDEIYLWIGEGTTEQERQSTLEMAKKFIHKDPTARTLDTVPIISIPQGKEPGCFKHLFPTWDDDYWKSIPSYEEVKKQISEANEKIEDNVIEP